MVAASIFLAVMLSQYLWALGPCTGLRNPTPAESESEPQNQNFPESESKKSTPQGTTLLTYELNVSNANRSIDVTLYHV
jgi:hypothetical protein